MNFYLLPCCLVLWDLLTFFGLGPPEFQYMYSSYCKYSHVWEVSLNSIKIKRKNETISGYFEILWHKYLLPKGSYSSSWARITRGGRQRFFRAFALAKHRRAREREEKEREKSGSAERKRKKREFVLLPLLVVLHWKPGPGRRSAQQGEKQRSWVRDTLVSWCSPFVSWQSYPGNLVLAILAVLFLAVLSQFFCPGGPALTVLFYKSFPDSSVLTILFCLSCSARPILTSRSGCPLPLLIVLSFLSSPGCPLLTVGSWRS